MKKIIALAIFLIMVITIAISANAAVGTVVYAQKVEKAPNMEAIDSTWGEKVIHVDKNTENANLTHYHDIYPGHTWYGLKAEEVSFDLYLVWTDKNLYLGVVTADDQICGHTNSDAGDGIEFFIHSLDFFEVNKATTEGLCDRTDPQNQGTKNGWYASYVPTNVYAVTLDFDDYSVAQKVPQPFYTLGSSECNKYINQHDNVLEIMIEIPMLNFGLKSSNDNTGAELGIALLRMCSAEVGNTEGKDGWLEWGKYFVQSSNKSINTIVLSDSSQGGDTASSDTQPVEDTTPEDQTNPSAADLSGVSSWALTEVEAAINEGLVPEYIQKDWTSPITRGQVSEMFIRLLEKATGKTVDAIIAEKGATIEEGKFEDTNDANVYAANALGIINGTSSSKFSPDGTLKRAQIAALINRVAKVVGVETEGYTHHFEDITDNYSWVDGELGWPSTVGIINGVSSTKFNPGGDLTTEQAILITYRALGALKQQ